MTTLASDKPAGLCSDHNVLEAVISHLPFRSCILMTSACRATVECSRNRVRSLQEEGLYGMFGMLPVDQETAGVSPEELLAEALKTASAIAGCACWYGHP